MSIGVPGAVIAAGTSVAPTTPQQGSGAAQQSGQNQNPNVVSPQAKTPPTGFALQNGTPTILTVNTPNDGQLHQYEISSFLNVTVLEVGGIVNVSYTCGGQATVTQLHAGAQGVGFDKESQVITADPNTAVRILQGTALTGGAATLYAVISGV